MTNVISVHLRRRRRMATAVALSLCLAAGAPGPVLAQQDLPDPNGRGGGERADRGGADRADRARGAGEAGLPNTGVSAGPLFTAAVALLAAGVAAMPIRRRRRAYSCDAWWGAMTSPGRQP